jgi:osmotically-inducible protein OsmY
LPTAFSRINIVKKTLWMPLVVALVAGTTIAACTSSTRTTESTGQFVDSAAITTKVKTAIVAEPGLKSLDISVDTFKDVVQLSGVVDSDQAKARATQVAAGVPGVKAVQNDLIVK